MVNKPSSFKTKLVGNSAEACRVNHNVWMFNFPTLYTADFPIQITTRQILGRGGGTFPLNKPSRDLTRLRRHRLAYDPTHGHVVGVRWPGHAPARPRPRRLHGHHGPRQRLPRPSSPPHVHRRYAPGRRTVAQSNHGLLVPSRFP